MSTEITMELIEPLLIAIKESVDATNKNVVELKADLKVAEKSINETATNYKLVDERLKNHEDRDAEKHKELEKSLSLNWTETRRLKEVQDKTASKASGIWIAVTSGIALLASLFAIMRNIKIG